MPVPRRPSAVFSAGAITSANRIGVSSGTRIWRGFCAVSAARRRASASSALGAATRRGARSTAGGESARVAMSILRFRRPRRARRRSAAGRRHRGWGCGRRGRRRAGRGRSSVRIASAAVRSCSGMVRRAPIANASPPATPCSRSRASAALGIAGDAQLEQLAAKAGEQRRRRVERDDLADVHDRDAVAQPLRLVEVVRREQDRQVAAGAQAGDHVEQLVPDPRVQPDGRLVEEQDARLGDQRAGDLEPPPLAAAVGADAAVDERVQPERGGQLGRCALAPARGLRPIAGRAARDRRRRSATGRRPAPGRRRC